MKERVNFPSSQFSASRQAAVALGAGFDIQMLGPAAVRSAAASFSLVRGSGQNRARRCAPVMGQQVNFPSSVASASRQAAVALGAGFVSQFFGPAAVLGAAASFCLVRGGRQRCGASAWPARSGLLLIWSTKVNNTGGTLQVFPFPPSLMPNPSFKPSPNGGPPGPVWRYAVHFRQSGPGVPPSVPA